MGQKQVGDRMSGFHEVIHTTMPWGRRGKRTRDVWIEVSRVTGSPPTMIHYQPPRRSYTDSNGEQYFLKEARWTIHHESGIYQLHGSAKHIIIEIGSTGLKEPIFSIGNTQEDGTHGDSGNE
jgi:hypothetical protein|tara:strand:+ start:5343 stop:5708 length:366 start_codon:yes stop_codon:yes gene_type:complete